MHILITGATGATGILLTEQFLARGHRVTAVVRSGEKLSPLAGYGENLIILEKEILAMDREELGAILENCDGAASCLGHNLTLKGLFGPPRRLVTEAARLVCTAGQTPLRDRPFKFVLMNTTGNRNRRERETAYGPGDRLVIGLLRLLLPPQADNEEAALFLQRSYSDPGSPVEWVAVRPDTLIDEAEATPREIVPSPLRSPLFRPGKTSRINVAAFMADLLEDEALWKEWSGKMPVIYNRNA